MAEPESPSGSSDRSAVVHVLTLLAIPFVTLYLVGRAVLGGAVDLIRRAASAIQSSLASLGRQLVWLGHRLGRTVADMWRGLVAVARSMGRTMGRFAKAAHAAIAPLWLRVMVILRVVGRAIAEVLRSVWHVVRRLGTRLALVAREIARAIATATRAVAAAVRRLWSRFVVVLKGVARQVARPIRWFGRLLRELGVRVMVILRVVGRAAARFITTEVRPSLRALAKVASRTIGGMREVVSWLRRRAIVVWRLTQFVGNAVAQGLRIASRLVSRWSRTAWHRWIGPAVRIVAGVLLVLPARAIRRAASAVRSILAPIGSAIRDAARAVRTVLGDATRGVRIAFRNATQSVRTSVRAATAGIRAGIAGARDLIDRILGRASRPDELRHLPAEAIAPVTTARPHQAKKAGHAGRTRRS